MRNVNKLKKSVLNVLTFMMVLMITVQLSSLTVFAAASRNRQLETTVTEAGNGQIPSNAAQYFSTSAPTGSESSNYYYIQVNNVKYYINKTNVSRVESICRGTAASGKMDTDLDGVNIQPDMEKTYGLLSGLGGVFSVLIGMIIVMITIGMAVFSAFDIVYIAFPTFRGWMDEQKANGTAGVTRSDKKTGETKLTLITEDAQYSVVAADLANTGKSPFTIYLRKRVWAYVILSVLLFILFTGNLTVFTNLGIKLAEGVVNFINETF